MMVQETKKHSFDWSLAPLKWVTRFTVGASIDFVNEKKRPSISTRLIFVLLGCFALFSNLLINGPRGINISNFDWMTRIQNFESPYLYFKEDPDALLQFVLDVTSICFFVAIPLMQIIFLASALFGNDSNQSIHNLMLIQKHFKLSSKFYQKSRNLCIVALLVLFLVKYPLEII